MGRQKLLLPFAGTTVIAHVVAQLRRAGVGEVIAVIGADAPEVDAALAGHAVIIARNPDYLRGMLSSVRAGLAAAPSHWTAALLVLGDQPLITPAILGSVLNAAGADRIAVPTFNGRRGHPILLPRCFWEEALTRHNDIGLRGVLRAHATAVDQVEVDSEDILADMDTPADYDAALARLAARDSGSAPR
jgi:molybdenum cofactor cytidylyltransferase